MHLTRCLSGAAVAMAMLAASPVRAQVTAPAGVTAFVDVAVVPMDRERVLTGQTVVVRGSQIAAIGPTHRVAVPAGAVRIDGRGKFLMPGLVDMHAHIPGASTEHLARKNDESMTQAKRWLFLYLANGITTVRVMYGWPETLRLRAQAATGELLSPRMYVAVAPIDFEPLPPDSALKFVTAAKAAGYDFIKVTAALGANAFIDSAGAVARRVGIPLVGHAPGGADGLEEAVRAGYSSIEHLMGFSSYLSDGRQGEWLGLSDAKLHAIVEVFRRAGVWNCPTVVNGARNYGFLSLVTDTAVLWPEARYLPDSLQQKWRQYAQLVAANAAADRAAGRAAFDAYAKIIRALWDGGAGLLLGTDAGTPMMLPGFSLHRELGALVQLGLTPYEALVTGTRNPALYFGTQDSIGTVALGKRADLVLLPGNPLVDIRYTARPLGVMLGGHWLSRAELDSRLKAIEGTVEESF